MSPKLRALWERTGGRIGLAICLAGFVAVFLGWNGAAGYDRVPSQFPYLFGALAGLGLVFLGAAMVVVEANRQQRAELKEVLEQVLAAVGGTGAAVPHTNGSSRAAAPSGAVVAGRSAYHRPDCRLVEGREGVTTLLTAEEARASGLTACRVCQPD